MSDARPIRLTAFVDTYNSGEFIEQAIESVLAQDFPSEEMEILVVDDGSTDDTGERVRKYGGRIRFFRKPNGGQASTLNFGIERARGEIVALLDGDDYWLAGKLRRIAAEFEKHPEAGMVYHNFFYKRERPRHILFDSGLAGFSGFLAEDRKKLLRYDLFPTLTLAFRRSVLQRLLPIPERLVVQADAHLSSCVIFVASVVYVPEPLAVHRVHAGNLWNWGGNTPPGGNIFQGDAASKARLERRIRVTQAIGPGVQEWLERNGFDVSAPDLRAFLAQWTMASRAGEFALSPPGRLRFFRHLLEQPRYFRTRMTWRHLVVQYANAVGSLLVGYRNYHRLDEWRLAIKRTLRSALGRSRA